MDYITKPSITRLARRAGIKNLSNNCNEIIKDLIDEKLEEIISVTLLINSNNQTKTLMVKDIYDALQILGENIAQI